jgi:hypothetical protein
MVQLVDTIVVEVPEHLLNGQNVAHPQLPSATMTARPASYCLQVTFFVKPLYSTRGQSRGQPFEDIGSVRMMLL